MRIHRGLLTRRVLIALAIVVALVGGAFAWLLWPYWRLAGQFEDHPVYQPSRLYGAARVLEPGRYLEPATLVAELERLGYKERSGEDGLVPGRFARRDGAVEVFLRTFPTARGVGGGAPLVVRFTGRRVAGLELAGREVEKTTLEPPLIASYYGTDFKERRPVVVDELPEELVQAVLAAEDDGFFSHSGVSPLGILRALWVNLRGGEVSQGGSTLTQQLVKNLYLTSERTVARKVREGVLALFVEARYSKRQILQAYLNEIYLGVRDGVNLVGVGAGAWAYCGKDVTQLELEEAALLAGIIPNPGYYNPQTQPERVRQRRDWVLDRMVEQGWLSEERAAAAKQRPLDLAPQRIVRRRAPYFADSVGLEAERRFGVGELDDAGYTLLTTLDAADQQAAEAAVAWGLEALEDGWQKGAKVDGPLQAALVSLDPETGAIRAYVGGRDYAASQYDRAGQAQRQAGSAFKPVVFATALERGVAAPSSLIEDSPLTVTLAGRRWSPQNDDDQFRGWVSVRTAMEKSLNVPTARLALQAGLPGVVETARGMGVTAPLQPLPALALGAFELTPVEMATIYGTLAAGGVRPTPHAVEAVFDRTGARLPGAPLPEPERALSPQTAYLLTSVLQGVLDRGTARKVRDWGVSDALAGKTGTTNGRRDSWFAGYAPGRVTAVWVGYDDNSRTRLSGARAALPIWARFTQRVRPPLGYPNFPRPPGIVTALIDPESGELATEDCSEILTEVFRKGQVPTGVCSLHRSWRAVPVAQPEVEVEERRSFRRWLRRVFGDDDDDDG